MGKGRGSLYGAVMSERRQWEERRLYMTLKLGITVLLVVFIAGAVIWLNLRHRKK